MISFSRRTAPVPGRTSTLYLFLLASSLLTPYLTSALCYTPSGALTEDRPCNPDGSSPSTCCQYGFECMSNTLCRNPGDAKAGKEGLYIRASCTDSKWDTPACMSSCVTGNPTGGEWVWSCGEGNFTCGTKDSCSQDWKVFHLGEASVIATAGITTPTPTAASSSSTSSSVSTSSPSSAQSAAAQSTSAPSSVSTRSSDSDNSSKGTTIGIGIGVGAGVGILSIASLVGVICCLRRRKRAKMAALEGGRAGEYDAQSGQLHDQYPMPGTVVNPYYKGPAPAGAHAERGVVHEAGGNDGLVELPQEPRTPAELTT